LRCIEKPTAVELSDDFFDATRTWLASKGVTAQDIAQLKTGSLSTEDPRLQRDDPTGIAAMIAAEQIPGWRAQNQTNEARLDTALDRAAAPPEVRALVIYLRWGHGLWRTAKFPSPHPSDAWEMFRAAEPNTRAAAWLTVEEAITFERFGDFKRARGLLQTVTEEPPTLLPADDRIRVLALLHEGLADARMGDAAAGQARIAEASLKPGACSLMDVKPLPTNLQIGSEYFPAEATRWGLSGYVKESFDIQADGRVKNVRTLLAYPPFIFEETTELAVGKFRYILPKINNDAVGCAGQTEGVSFVGF